MTQQQREMIEAAELDRVQSEAMYTEDIPAWDDEVPCDACNGTGQTPGRWRKPCTTCEGTAVLPA